jgi:hypothetical protein
MIWFDINGREHNEPYWIWKMRGLIKGWFRKKVKYFPTLGKEQFNDFDDGATDGSENNWGRTHEYHNF